MMDLEDTQTDTPNIQTRWDNITEANRKAAVDTLYQENRRKSDDNTVVLLSEKQRELGAQINSTSDQERKAELRKIRNQTLNSIHQKLKEQEYQRITEQIDRIENSNNDTSRMFAAVKVIQGNTNRMPLIINTEEGKTAEPIQQVKIVTDYFNEMFSVQNTEALPDIEPAAMETPFSKDEIRKAVKSLKDGKSAGYDRLKAEQLKHGPDIVLEHIADILNHVARTGEFPEDLKKGILIPLQKPGKSKGPPENLRPIILLSALRKILAICMIWRIGDKIDSSIPIRELRGKRGCSTSSF